jgi:hypothetical protein
MSVTQKDEQILLSDLTRQRHTRVRLTSNNNLLGTNSHSIQSKLKKSIKVLVTICKSHLYLNCHHDSQNKKRNSYPKERFSPEAPHLSLSRVSFQHLNYQRSGGKSNNPNPGTRNTSLATDEISVSSTSIQSTHEWTAHSTILECANINLEEHIRHEFSWRPTTSIPYRAPTHTLGTTISTNTLIKIKNLCQLPPSTPIFRSTRKPDLHITVEHLRDLVSYGNETNDAIILLYLELLCYNSQATYMTTYFLPKLKQQGWRYVSRFFSSSLSGYRSRKIDRPHKTGEKAIMIPLFVADTHWVALVRREIEHTVTFFYSDDMNQRNTEHDIKRIIYEKTDTQFCPPDAKWVSCKSTYYINHSNECGPRTLLMALHIMAFHPKPHCNMLLPIMDTNIAQLCRTWIAASFISGHPLHESLALTYSTLTYIDTRHSCTLPSDPHDIILWEQSTETTNNQTGDPSDHPPPFITTQSSEESIAEPRQEVSYLRQLPMLASPQRIQPLQGENLLHQESPINHSHISKGSRSGPNFQTKITEWTIHRSTPNATGLPNDELHHDCSIMGTLPPLIDPTKTLRILTQNTQYSLQLTNENYHTMHLTQRLKELSTAVFVAISPNINWHNSSHLTRFKYPFQRIFKQIHISATSSDIPRQKQEMPHYYRSIYISNERH